MLKQALRVCHVGWGVGGMEGWGRQKVLNCSVVWAKLDTHVAKLGEITGKTRVLYSELMEITGKTRVLPCEYRITQGLVEISSGTVLVWQAQNPRDNATFTQMSKPIQTLTKGDKFVMDQTWYIFPHLFLFYTCTLIQYGTKPQLWNEKQVINNAPCSLTLISGPRTHVLCNMYKNITSGPSQFFLIS